MLASKGDPDFPSEKAFRRLGSKSRLAARVISFCAATPGHEDIAALWSGVTRPTDSTPTAAEETAEGRVGYVYLLRHGSRSEYKIGRTYNPISREGEIGIQLPEKLRPVHYIETDDPPGVETYWHARFAAKRKEGEWFDLVAADVRAFKRWKRIY